MRFLVNFTKLSSRNLIALALPFCILPFLTRFIDADQIGIYTLFFSIVGTLSSIATLKFESAILVSENEENPYLFLVSILLSKLFSLILLVFGVVLFLFSKKSYSLWFLFVPFCIFFNGIIQSLNSFLQRENKFKIIGLGRIIINAVSNILPFLILYLEYLNVLIVSYIISQILTIVYLVKKSKIIYILSNLLKVKKDFIWSRVKSLLKKYKIFALYDTPGSLLDHGANLIIVSTIFVIANSKEAASYGIASKILMFPIALVTTPLTQVLLNEFLNLSRNRVELKKFTIKIIKLLTLITIFPVLIFSFFSTNIFHFLFGEGWQESGKIVSIFAFSQFLIFVISPISILLIVVKWNRINTLWKLLRFCSILLISLIASNNVHRFYVYISISEIILYLVYFIIIFKAIQNVRN